MKRQLYNLFKTPLGKKKRDEKTLIPNARQLQPLTAAVPFPVSEVAREGERKRNEKDGIY